MSKVLPPLIATTLVLAGIAYFVWQGGATSGSAGAVAGSLEKGRIAIPAALPGAAGSLPVATTPALSSAAPPRPAARPPHGGLGSMLTRARGSRSFVMDTLAGKDPQSLPYAWRVLEDCRKFLALSIADGVSQPNMALVLPQDQAAASAAFTRLQIRCELFTPDEVALVGGLERSFSQAKATTLNGKISGLLAQGTDTGRREALQLAIDAADPLLWDTLGSRLLLQKDQKGIYLGYSGSKYYAMGDIDAMAAIELVPCLLGLPCGADTTEVSIDCALGQGCFSSRLDKFEKRYAGEGKGQYAAILSLATSIAAAILAGDAKALTP